MQAWASHEECQGYTGAVLGATDIWLIAEALWMNSGEEGRGTTDGRKSTQEIKINYSNIYGNNNNFKMRS